MAYILNYFYILDLIFYLYISYYNNFYFCCRFCYNKVYFSNLYYYNNLVLALFFIYYYN